MDHIVVPCFLTHSVYSTGRPSRWALAHISSYDCSVCLISRCHLSSSHGQRTVSK